MKFQQNPSTLPLPSFRVVPDGLVITGPYCYTKREALIHWLLGVAAELSQGRSSEEDVIKALQLEEVFSSEP